MSKQKVNPKHSDLSKCRHRYQFLLEEILIQRRIWFPPVLTSAGLWRSDGQIDEWLTRGRTLQAPQPDSECRNGWTGTIFSIYLMAFKSHSGICKYCGI